MNWKKSWKFGACDDLMNWKKWLKDWGLIILWAIALGVAIFCLIYTNNLPHYID